MLRLNLFPPLNTYPSILHIATKKHNQIEENMLTLVRSIKEQQVA